MFSLAIIAAVFIRVYLILRNSIPFAYDMGRDLLWAKDISFYGIPTLIGPAASIWGVYFGPLWFYFLSVPLLISGGNPLSAVYATSTIVVLTGILAFWLFKKILGKTFAFVLATILFFSPTLINISTFAFHANLLPLLTLLVIYFCFLAITKKPIYLALAFFAASLMFHADPAPAVVFSLILIFVFFFFKLHRSKNLPRIVSFSSISYLIPFVPHILFEVRNNFIQTKSLVTYFAGGNPSLSGQLPFLERIFNRTLLYFDFFKASFAGENSFIAILLIAIVILGIWRLPKTKNGKNLFILLKINLISIIVSFLIFAVFITVEIKNWYLYGLTVPMAFLIIFSLSSLRKYKLLIVFFLVGYLIINVTPFFRNERIVKVKLDPAQLSNQLTVINAIYHDSQHQPFSVYVFTPSIYDYPYQYLFWWQGIKQDKGLPTDFAYLPNQPNYVRNKEVYAPKGEISPIIYLIMEKGRENEFYTQDAWLKNFDNFDLIWEKEVNHAIILQKRLQ